MYSCSVCGSGTYGITILYPTFNICFVCIWLWVQGAMSTLWIWDASDPIMLPVHLKVFKHPHMGELGIVVLDTVPGMDLYCVTRRPVPHPRLKSALTELGYISDLTTCGRQDIRWRLK